MTFYFDNTAFCHFGYFNNEFQAGAVIQIFENNQMGYMCDYENIKFYPRNIQPDNIKIDLCTDKILYDVHEKYVALSKYKEMESMVYNLSEKIKQYERKRTVIDKILDSVKERGLKQTAGICFRKIVGKMKK